MLPRTYSKQGLQLTEKFEGCKLVAYKDSAGVWTIGWGHTHGVVESMTCTQEQADTWLVQDLQWAQNAVNLLVTVNLTQHEFDALVDFVFNLGTPAFVNSTMLRLINSKRFAEAAEEFHKWDHAGGKEIAGLLRRRLEEKNEFLTEEGGTKMADQTITVTVPSVTATMSPAQAPAPSAGFKSTEFLATLAAALPMVLGFVPDKYAPMLTALVAVYVACRTALKAVHVMGYAQQIPDLPEVPVALAAGNQPPAKAEGEKA